MSTRWRGKEQRRFVRFAAMCRVEYPAGGAMAVGFTGELSSGGFFLKQARGLKVGEQVTCALRLADGEPAITVRCGVRCVTGEGAGLQFATGQNAAVTRVRRFIAERLAAPLHERSVRPSATVDEIERYALYCAETGRIDEGLEVFRKAVERRPGELGLYEGMAPLLMQRAHALGERAAPVVAELDRLLRQAAKIGTSESLDAVACEMRALQQELDRHKKEERARLDRELEALLAQTAPAALGRDKPPPGTGRPPAAAAGQKPPVAPLGGVTAAKQKELVAERAKVQREREELERQRRELSAARTASVQSQQELKRARWELERLRGELQEERRYRAEERRAFESEQRLAAGAEGRPAREGIENERRALEGRHPAIVSGTSPTPAALSSDTRASAGEAAQVMPRYTPGDFVRGTTQVDSNGAPESADLAKTVAMTAGADRNKLFVPAERAGADSPVPGTLRWGDAPASAQSSGMKTIQMSPDQVQNVLRSLDAAGFGRSSETPRASADFGYGGGASASFPSEDAVESLPERMFEENAECVAGAGRAPAPGSVWVIAGVALGLAVVIFVWAVWPTAPQSLIEFVFPGLVARPGAPATSQWPARSPAPGEALSAQVNSLLPPAAAASAAPLTPPSAAGSAAKVPVAEGLRQPARGEASAPPPAEVKASPAAEAKAPPRGRHVTESPSSKKPKRAEPAKATPKNGIYSLFEWAKEQGAK
jgi:hypothetical protein